MEIVRLRPRLYPKLGNRGAVAGWSPGVSQRAAATLVLDFPVRFAGGLITLLEYGRATFRWSPRFARAPVLRNRPSGNGATLSQQWCDFVAKGVLSSELATRFLGIVTC